MQESRNLRDRYIQLIESFITALESGKSGSELEEIRKEIRTLSSSLGMGNSVEKSTQQFGLLAANGREEGARNEDNP
jgi:hypothetical protein